MLFLLFTLAFIMYIVVAFDIFVEFYTQDDNIISISLMSMFWLPIILLVLLIQFIKRG